MRLQGILASSVMLLSGCATLGIIPTPGAMTEAVSASEVVQEIQCEMLRGLGNPPSSFFGGSQFASVLTLGTTDNATGTPNVTFTSKSVAGLQLPGGLTTGDKALYTRSMSFNTKVDELEEPNAALATTCASPEYAGGSDGLGLDQWIRDTDTALKGQSGVATLTALVYDVHFIVSRTATGGLIFKNTVWDVEVGKQAFEHDHDNELKVTLTPGTKKAPAVQAPASPYAAHGIVRRGGTPLTPDEILKQNQFIDSLQSNSTIQIPAGSQIQVVPAN